MVDIPHYSSSVGTPNQSDPATVNIQIPKDSMLNVSAVYLYGYSYQNVYNAAGGVTDPCIDPYFVVTTTLHSNTRSVMTQTDPQTQGYKATPLQKSFTVQVHAGSGDVRLPVPLNLVADQNSEFASRFDISAFEVTVSRPKITVPGSSLSIPQFDRLTLFLMVDTRNQTQGMPARLNANLNRPLPDFTMMEWDPQVYAVNQQNMKKQ